MRLFFVVILAFALAACSSSADKSFAEHATVDFHEMLDAGQFDAIYAGAGQELKDVAKQQDFVALLQAVHKKLGNLRSTVPQGWNVNYQTSGTFVTLGYATHYAEGDASEQFVYRIKDGKALLVGYNINSNALILK